MSVLAAFFPCSVVVAKYAEDRNISGGGVEKVSLWTGQPNDGCVFKGVFIATQLNSTRRRVVDTFTA